MYKCHQHNLTLSQCNWIEHVHTLLLSNGFGYVWQMDFEHNNHSINHIKLLFKERIKLQYIQDWHTCSSINSSSKCTLYKHIKDDFILEKYLYTIPWKYSKYILKLRMSNHKLIIETG